MMIDIQKLHKLTNEEMLSVKQVRLTPEHLKTIDKIKVIASNPSKERLELFGAIGWAQIPTIVYPGEVDKVTLVSFAETPPPIFYVNETVRMSISELSLHPDEVWHSEKEEDELTAELRKPELDDEPHDIQHEMPVIDEGGYIEEPAPAIAPLPNEPMSKPQVPQAPLPGEPPPPWRAMGTKEKKDFSMWCAEQWSAHMEGVESAMSILREVGYAMSGGSQGRMKVMLRYFGGFYADAEHELMCCAEKGRHYLMCAIETDVPDMIDKGDSVTKEVFMEWHSIKMQEPPKIVGIDAHSGQAMVGKDIGTLGFVYGKHHEYDRVPFQMPEKKTQFPGPAKMGL